MKMILIDFIIKTNSEIEENFVIKRLVEFTQKFVMDNNSSSKELNLTKWNLMLEMISIALNNNEIYF